MEESEYSEGEFVRKHPNKIEALFIAVVGRHDGVKVKKATVFHTPPPTATITLPGKW